jgi:hypothetical protein
MQMYDPNLYVLWVLITQGDVDNPSKIIAGKFGSQYVHTDLKHKEFIKIAENDPGLEKVYSDDQAMIFKVISP